MYMILGFRVFCSAARPGVATAKESDVTNKILNIGQPTRLIYFLSDPYGIFIVPFLSLHFGGCDDKIALTF